MALADGQGRVKPDCMFLTSSITQVIQTRKAITPDTAAKRAAPRSRTSTRLISFTVARATPPLCRTSQGAAASASRAASPRRWISRA
jgi:hypothetical protein